jgi:hypothetical protein
VTGDDLASTVHQNRRVESERPNAIGDLSHLFMMMETGVSGIGSDVS